MICNVMLEKCVDEELRISFKSVSSLQFVGQIHIDGHVMTPKDYETTRTLIAIGVQIKMNCLYLARFGRSESFVNTLVNDQ